MNIHADKTLENKGQSVANAISKKQSSSDSSFQFVDNRPEAIAQRKLQEMTNNSLQAKQAVQLQAIAANYSAQQPQPFQKKGNNTGLPDNLKTGLKNLSGYSMDDDKGLEREVDVMGVRAINMLAKPLRNQKAVQLQVGTEPIQRMLPRIYGTRRANMTVAAPLPQVPANPRYPIIGIDEAAAGHDQRQGRIRLEIRRTAMQLHLNNWEQRDYEERARIVTNVLDQVEAIENQADRDDAIRRRLQAFFEPQRRPRGRGGAPPPYNPNSR